MTRILAVLLILAPAVRADEAEPAPKKLTDKERAAAEKAAKAHLEKLGGKAARFTEIKDEALAKAMPGHAFYAVLFPQYPVGRMPPEKLKVANVFAADGKGKVAAITSLKELEKFLGASMPAASGEAGRKGAAQAAVRLGQELHQDGFYKFKADDAKAEKGKASAKAVVMSGGSGAYSVTLAFSDGGKVTGLEEKSELVPGPRPICQATKLLDPDPIVRGMAEQALVCMGRACKPYLTEQRAKASPELRGAIDRLWRRIAAAGR
ncbi:MAG: hypothetical protein K2W96_08410 [Gemmataceae bacterium]|nr:hypothetical protein [Gemmataceae bacterium]